MAGSIALSLTQRFDNVSHLPLNGGKLYFYAAGTDTPQSAYQDINLANPLPNPITLDSGGNVPQLFFADGYIKFRLANADGLVQLAADYVLVLGPTSGGGAAPSVDATTILSTGDIKCRHGVGNLTGFVRLNARTIGSATSGASERANSDTQALFEYLWNTDANLAVSTGRGASSTADYAANKTITLPDGRGRVLAGLDDMGNSAAGRLTATYFGTAATVLGAAGGTESQTLTNAQIPPHNHEVTDPGHVHRETYGTPAGSGSNNDPLGNTSSGNPSDAAISTKPSVTGITIQNTGGGGAHPIVQPTMLVTIYIKL